MCYNKKKNAQKEVLNMKKVVFHIDEMKNWSLTLGNVKNLITFYEHHDEVFQIVVVANGEAVKGYGKEDTQENIAKEILALFAKGISFHACQNALRAQQLEAVDLLEHIVIVEAGVADIVALQEKGFTYIKS